MENTEIDTSERSPEAQKIIDAELGIEKEVSEDNEIKLPSDDGQDEEYLFAGKYKSVEALKDGISNIGSNLPEYVLNGMSDEALEKHYSELQKNTPTEERGRKFAEKKKEEKEVTKKTPDDVKATGVSDELWSELNEQFTTNGNITAEQYDLLNKAGIPDTVIDSYLDGIQAKTIAEQQQFTSKVYEIAGGEEQYSEIKAWAEDGGIPQDRLAEISAMKDYRDITLAMYEIKSKYDSSVGSSSNQTIRANKQSRGSSGYSSQSDYLADVNDMKYKTDARFRDAVKAKLSRSSLT